MTTDYAPPKCMIDEWKKHCQCCPNCSSHPCDGVAAGGICDSVECDCFSDDDEQPYGFEQECKGGKLARRAAMLCQNPDFRIWLDRRRRKKFNMDIPDGTHTEECAREFILLACEVESRRELDHNPHAANKFMYVIKLFSHYNRRCNNQ